MQEVSLNDDDRPGETMRALVQSVGPKSEFLALAVTDTTVVFKLWRRLIPLTQVVLPIVS